MVGDDTFENLGRIMKQRRIAAGLTLRELSGRSGVSSSHLGRVERGERFPSAHILKRVAEHLGFDEGELFAVAGFLSPPKVSTETETTTINNSGQLDPIVARLLAQEPVQVQRTVVALITILKSVARWPA